MPLTLITALVIVFFAVAFSLQNDQVVSIQFFRWQFEGSLVLVLLAALCLGIVIEILASMPARVRKSRQITQLTKRVMELEETPHVATQEDSRKPYPD